MTTPEPDAGRSKGLCKTEIHGRNHQHWQAPDCVNWQPMSKLGTCGLDSIAHPQSEFCRGDWKPLPQVPHSGTFISAEDKKELHERVAERSPLPSPEAQPGSDRTWAMETMQIINDLTPDIKEKAFDPDWFLLRQRLEEFERGSYHKGFAEGARYEEARLKAARAERTSAVAPACTCPCHNEKDRCEQCCDGAVVPAEVPQPGKEKE